MMIHGPANVKKNPNYYSLSLNNIIDTQFIFFGVGTDFLYIFQACFGLNNDN
jgi:hypothetical protein